MFLALFDDIVIFRFWLFVKAIKKETHDSNQTYLGSS